MSAWCAHAPRAGLQGKPPASGYVEAVLRTHVGAWLALAAVRPWAAVSHSCRARALALLCAAVPWPRQSPSSWPVDVGSHLYAIPSTPPHPPPCRPPCEYQLNFRTTCPASRPVSTFLHKSTCGLRCSLQRVSCSCNCNCSSTVDVGHSSMITGGGCSRPRETVVPGLSQRGVQLS